MKPSKIRLSRPATRRGGAQQARPSGSSRISGKPSLTPQRPSFREQLAAPVQPRRRADPTTTRRAVILGGILAVMLIVLMPALRSYLDQASAISELKQTKAQNAREVSRLEAEKKQWADPNYVKKQAEQRLGFTEPGKQAVIYVDRSNNTHKVQSAAGVAQTDAYRAHPWYGQVWSSITVNSNTDK